MLPGDSTIGLTEFVAVARNHNQGTADTGQILVGASATPAAGSVPSGAAKAVPHGIAPEEFYYSFADQVLQTNSLNNQTGEMQVDYQNVWGLAYVNQLILRDSIAIPTPATLRMGPWASAPA